MAKVIDMQQKIKKLTEGEKRFKKIEKRFKKADRDGEELYFAEFFLKVPACLPIPPALYLDEQLPEKDFLTLGDYIDAWGGTQVILDAIIKFNDLNLNWISAAISVEKEQELRETAAFLNISETQNYELLTL